MMDRQEMYTERVAEDWERFWNSITATVKRDQDGCYIEVRRKKSFLFWFRLDEDGFFYEGALTPNFHKIGDLHDEITCALKDLGGVPPAWPDKAPK